MSTGVNPFSEGDGKIPEIERFDVYGDQMTIIILAKNKSYVCFQRRNHVTRSCMTKNIAVALETILGTRIKYCQERKD